MDAPMVNAAHHRQTLCAILETSIGSTAAEGENSRRLNAALRDVQTMNAAPVIQQPYAIIMMYTGQAHAL